MTLSKKIDVIGVDVINEPLSERKQRLISKADVVVAGRKNLELIPFFTGETVSITGDIDSLIADIHQYLEQNRRIVVLATGDPLLFGIGNTLVQHFGHDAIDIHPGISAVQAALSRLGLRSYGMVVLSRHGAREDDLRDILHHPVGVVLTSHSNSPSEIIQELMDNFPQTGEWQGHVCQCMGAPDESIKSGTLKQLSAVKTFHTPNLLVVENPSPICPDQISANFGQPDDMYAHEAGLITHPEVRAVTLSKLTLSGAATLWDVGAGSGSVGIEAAQLNPYLSVFSIEKNVKRFGQIISNVKKNKINNLFPVQGNALEVCLSLPAPDRVFVGGGGEELSDLLPLCYNCLTKEGVMVVNTVTIDSFEIVRHFFKHIQKEIEVVSLQISRLQPLAAYHAFRPDNPITIFGIKK